MVIAHKGTAMLRNRTSKIWGPNRAAARMKTAQAAINSIAILGNLPGLNNAWPMNSGELMGMGMGMGMGTQHARAPAVDSPL